MAKWISNLLAWFVDEAGRRTRPRAAQDEIAAMVYVGDVYPVRVLSERSAPSVPVRSRRESDAVWPFIR